MSKNVTVKKAAEEFVQQIEALGKKDSTVGTSKRCLDLFVAHQGEEKLVAKLLPVHVAAFFKSESANKNNGKPRAEASILQIRRVVRQFLIWTAEKKYVATLPIPRAELERGGGVRIPKDQQQADGDVAQSTQEISDAQHNEGE
jgi:hypothetical protein